MSLILHAHKNFVTFQFPPINPHLVNLQQGISAIMLLACVTVEFPERYHTQ